MENYNIVTSNSDVSLSVGKAPPIAIQANESSAKSSDRSVSKPPEWGLYEQRTVTEYRPERQKPIRVKKNLPKNSRSSKKKIEAIALYEYLKDLYYDKAPYSSEYLHQAIRAGLKTSQTQVTTLLLYTADLRGLNRPDIVVDALDVLMGSTAVGFTFRQTLIKGLAWRHYWKLIFGILEHEKIDSKTRTYIFTLVRSAINRGNPNDLKEMPRQGTAVNRVRGFLKLTPAEWRHTLVDGSGDNLSAVMSSNNWSLIDYAKVPVFLISKMYKGFMRHDRNRFRSFLRLNKQTAKTAYQIKHHFRKRTFLPIETIVKTYFVPMSSTMERKSSNGRYYNQGPREFKRRRA